MPTVLDKVFEVLTDSPPISGKVSRGVFSFYSDPFRSSNGPNFGADTCATNLGNRVLSVLHLQTRPKFYEREKNIRLKKNPDRLQHPSDFCKPGNIYNGECAKQPPQTLTHEFAHQAGTYLRNQNFLCIPSDKSESPEATLAVRVHYSYLLLKYFDLVETVRSIAFFYAPADRNV
jgi:hypothetical protein